MKAIIVTKRTALKTAGLVIAAALAVVFMAIGLVSIFAKNTDAESAMAGDKLVPVYRVDRDDKAVALTFDAAWGSEKTVGILDILDEYDIKSTFFLVGFWIDSYPERVKQIAARGHEIGNHSTNHPNMPQLSTDEMIEEIVTCQQKIEALTGMRPTLFRAPYGDYSNDLLNVLREQGYECIQWDVDSLDWKDPGAEAIISRVCDNVQNGSIVLFHNNSEDILNVLPTIIEKLRDEGYTFMTVSDLLYDAPYTIDRTGTQHKD